MDIAASFHKEVNSMRTRKNLFLLFTTLIMVLTCVNPVFASDFDISIDGTSGITIKPGSYPDLSGTDLENIQDDISETVVNKTKSVAQTITAVCAIICFVFFFINVVKLTTSGGIPFMRRAAIIGLLWSGVAIALFGGGWVVITFFWNFLRG